MFRQRGRTTGSDNHDKKRPGAAASRQDRIFSSPALGAPRKRGSSPPKTHTHARRIFATKLPPFGKKLCAVLNLKGSGATSSNHLVTFY